MPFNRTVSLRLIFDDVLSIVRDAAGLKSVGYKAWEILGDRAQLDQWNKVYHSQANRWFPTTRQMRNSRSIWIHAAR